MPPSACQCLYVAPPPNDWLLWLDMRQTEQSKRTKSSSLPPRLPNGTPLTPQTMSCLWIGNATRAVFIPLVSDLKRNIQEQPLPIFLYGCGLGWDAVSETMLTLPISSRPMHWASHAKALSVECKCFRASMEKHDWDCPICQ